MKPKSIYSMSLKDRRRRVRSAKVKLRKRGMIFVTFEQMT